MPIEYLMVADGEVDPEKIDALIDYAVSIGVRVYCPLKLGPDQAVSGELADAATVTFPDMQKFSAGQTDYNPNAHLAERVWNQLALRRGDVLRYTGPAVKIGGYQRYQGSELEFASLKGLMERVNEAAETSGNLKRAIATHLGPNFGEGMFRFLNDFVAYTQTDQQEPGAPPNDGQ